MTDCSNLPNRPEYINMSHETPPRSAESDDSPGHSGRSAGEQSPLQARAAFLKNWDWQLVVGFNRGACERGSAQHGPNSEAFSTCQSEWESFRLREVTLAETLDFLRQCHKRAPFLFFNGNTFADIGRRLVAALLAELPPSRLRQATSSIAHYIAGVLDREAMIGVVESLCATIAAFLPGMRVRTLRGSSHGVVVRILDDGRVVWRTDAGTEFIALPETLTTDM